MIQSKQMDATQGKLLPLIFQYAIPLIVSTLIQKLFGAVDIAVLGQMASTEAVASVGATASIIDLVVNSFLGISAGARILLAYQFGQKDEQQLRRTVGSALSLAAILGFVVMALGLVCSPLLLTVTQCPAECLDGAVSYLRIYMLAAPAILLYHFGSAVQMTSGDTRRPLYYMVASSSLNVILNVILCLSLPNKVVAVAIATAAAQILGAILVLLRLFRAEGMMRISWRDIRLHAKPLGRILRFGVPMALTNSLFPLAGLQIQSAVNGLGAATIAGDSSASIFGGVTAAFCDSFLSAMGTFVGQNLGAEKPQRVRASIFHTTWLSVSAAAFFGLFAVLTGRILGGDAAAVEVGMIRVFWLIGLYFLFELAYSFSVALQSFGYPTFTSVINLAWILGYRVLWMTFLYPHFPTYTCLVLCFFTSWFGMLLCNSIAFFVVWRRYRAGKMVRM